MQESQHVFRFPGTPQGFDEATGALSRLLDVSHVEGSPRRNVELAFEEIGTNIVKYGAPTGNIEVTILFEPDEVILTFEDDGVAFDPREHQPPRPSSLDDAPIGGLGVMLVKKFSTRLDYVRTPTHHNRLTVAIAAH